MREGTRDRTSKQLWQDNGFYVVKLPINVDTQYYMYM